MLARAIYLFLTQSIFTDYYKWRNRYSEVTMVKLYINSDKNDHS